MPDEHGWDHLTFGKAVDALVDNGQIRSWTAGGNYRIRPEGIIYAEEQGIASEAQIKVRQELRTQLLALLRELYDKEGRSAAKHVEALATETGVNLILYFIIFNC